MTSPPSQSPDDIVPSSHEETLITLPNVVVHLVSPNNSVQLASGSLTIVSLHQNGTIVAVLARVEDQLQWPLAKDEPVVKLDKTHYLFTLRVPGHDPSGDRSGGGNTSGGEIEVLNYGVSLEGGECEGFDEVLDKYGCFKVGGVNFVEENCGAYWAVLGENVEEYSGSVARLIASGSGQLAKGILWCGDVTVERLNWGREFVMKRVGSGSGTERDVDPETIARIQRVKKVTKMSEQLATGILSGVVKVSGFFTSAIVNSTVGKKFFNLMPGEIVLASLDGFNKVFDAIEHAGKSVMSTSSIVTTELVTHRYGDKAAKATSEGLGAAGHAIGTAWAVLKIRKALNPKSAIKPTTLAKASLKVNASDLKAKSTKN